MDSQRLKTFRTVATLLNFNRAAEVLNFAQSTVSAQVRTLEEELGVPLFNRVGKRVFLTPAGERMLHYADKLLALEEEARADVSGQRQTTGRLTLRVPQTIATYYLPSVLARFQPQYPGISLEVSSCAVHSLEHELRIGTADLAFLLTGSIQAAGLDSLLIRTERLTLAAGADHPLAGLDRVGPLDLEGRTILFPKADCGYGVPLGQALAARMVKPRAVLEFTSLETIRNCVRAGLGVTVIPRVAVEEDFVSGRLVELDWPEEMETGVLMV